MITRRDVLKSLGLSLAGSLALAGYGFGVEPMRLRVARYTVRVDTWPARQRTRIAALADLHACRPWMSPERIEHIVDETNRLRPDLTVLLGDYTTGHRWVSGEVRAPEWSSALSGLNAPLGVHAVMGNHDWWDDRTAQQRGRGPTIAQLALEKAGITVYENQVSQLRHQDHRFWIAGLGDQLALIRRTRSGRRTFRGIDDLAGTLAKANDGAPVILLAHEPDIFPQVPDRVCLTLAGHTHGGQVRLFGYSPVVPSRYGNRYAYGHILERQDANGAKPRNLVVSVGLGNSILPVRFGVPPEITLIDVVGTGVLQGQTHSSSA
ncbi:MAG: metallophosphoesterase [Pseudomonadota bacterium]